MKIVKFVPIYKGKHMEPPRVPLGNSWENPWENPEILIEIIQSFVKTRKKSAR